MNNMSSCVALAVASSSVTCLYYCATQSGWILAIHVVGDAPFVGQVGLVAHQNYYHVTPSLRPHVVYPFSG